MQEHLLLGSNLLLKSTTLLECEVLHIFHHPPQAEMTYCVQFFTNSCYRGLHESKWKLVSIIRFKFMCNFHFRLRRMGDCDVLINRKSPFREQYNRKLIAASLFYILKKIRNKTQCLIQSSQLRK